MAHTSGPWKAVCIGVRVLGPKRIDVYEINSGHGRIAEFVDEEDAYLIAAAPELLEALKAAREKLCGNADSGSVAVINAAIAKAEGK